MLFITKYTFRPPAFDAIQVANANAVEPVQDTQAAAAEVPGTAATRRAATGGSQTGLGTIGTEAAMSAESSVRASFTTLTEESLVAMLGLYVILGNVVDHELAPAVAEHALGAGDHREAIKFSMNVNLVNALQNVFRCIAAKCTAYIAMRTMHWCGRRSIKSVFDENMAIIDSAAETLKQDATIVINFGEFEPFRCPCRWPHREHRALKEWGTPRSRS